MPIYVYEREDGTTFENIHSHGQWLEACPETQQPVIRIKYPGANFQLKGGGWAKDGYASQRKASRTIESHIDEHRADLKSQKEDYLSKR